jgi:hypothetical protein
MAEYRISDQPRNVLTLYSKILLLGIEMGVVSHNRNPSKTKVSKLPTIIPEEVKCS